MENKIPTLYEWAGGNEALEKLTQVFTTKFLKTICYIRFSKICPVITANMWRILLEKFLAVQNFILRPMQGSHYKMIAHHLGKMLDEPKRKRWIALLLESCDEINLADDPEFRSALVGYLEWGSRIAVINSKEIENPLDNSEPMPVWGWGETGGPYIPK